VRTNKINILIVDDIEDNRVLMESILECDDYNIVSVASGYTALNELEKQEFALILLDVQMPEIDGFETAKLIKQNERIRNIPIIFATALSKERENIFKGYGTGAVDYLFKPISNEILQSKVRTFADLYKQKLVIQENNERLNQLNTILSTKNIQIEEQHDLLIEKQMTLESVLQQLETKSIELALKNKEFTDSVRYAKRIQQSIFPHKGFIEEMIPESFILLKPKDILSGDFYWYEKLPQNNFGNSAVDCIYLAAVDCTGHGVPGALLSILGNNLLNNIMKELGDIQPSKILHTLNNNVISILNQSGDAIVKDGMDVALIKYVPATKQLWFSGANRPLYLIRKQGNNYELQIYKGNQYAIGCDGKCVFAKFFDHEIQLQTGDTIYLFSDGYPDQFGGLEGKKFKYEKFRKLLLSIQDQPMKEQKNTLIQTLNDWKNTLEQVDDILVIGFRIL